MKILYCTDFTEAALYSFEKALPFLKPGCEADIISVIEPGYEQIEFYKQNKIKNLEKTKQLIVSKGINVLETLSPEGSPAEEIIDQLYNKDYELVITGSRRDFLTKWLGSTSRKIVTKTPVPIFIAKKTEKTNNKKDIVFAVDGSRNSRNAVEKAIEIFDFTQSKIEIIYVKQEKESLPVEIISDKAWLGELLKREEQRAKEIIGEISQLIEEKGFKAEAGVALEGDAATEIMKYSENNKKDLIIMGSHGRGSFSAFILGSVSKRVLDNTMCPVAIIPPERD